MTQLTQGDVKSARSEEPGREHSEKDKTEHVLPGRRQPKRVVGRGEEKGMGRHRRDRGKQNCGESTRPREHTHYKQVERELSGADVACMQNRNKSEWLLCQEVALRKATGCCRGLLDWSKRRTWVERTGNSYTRRGER